MTSLITGTWSLISSSRDMITGAQRITARVHRLQQPGHFELSESDKRRLVGLQRRVECLVQPLNFLLLWSRRRDACVHQIVLNAQELLYDICAFLERFSPQEQGPGSGAAVRNSNAGPDQAGLDSEQLQFYLKELEFTCAAVTMAVSIERAAAAPAVELAPHSQGQSGGDHGQDAGGVSVMALLRASRRIQEMHGKSGDLCACPGRLYSATAFAAASQPLPLRELRGSSAAAEDEASTMPRPSSGEWRPAVMRATFKVVASIDSRTGRRGYSIVVESHSPLGNPASFEGVDAGSHAQQQGPVNFAIDVALDANLTTTACVALPTEPAHWSDEVGIDSPVLLWCAIATNDTALLEADAELPDAVLVPDCSEGRGSTLRQASAARRARPVGNNSVLQPGPGGCWAFVFEGPRGGAELHAVEAEVVLTPLDTLYLARLCSIDDGHQQSSLTAAVGQEGADTCPPHLLTSDEVIRALLQDGTSTWRSAAARVPMRSANPADVEEKH